MGILYIRAQVGPEALSRTCENESKLTRSRAPDARNSMNNLSNFGRRRRKKNRVSSWTWLHSTFHSQVVFVILLRDSLPSSHIWWHRVNLAWKCVNLHLNRFPRFCLTSHNKPIYVDFKSSKCFLSLLLSIGRLHNGRRCALHFPA